MKAPKAHFPSEHKEVVVALKDSVHQREVSRFFQRQGWSVLQPESAEHIYRMCATRQPDLVVLDTEWPVESGWLVCKKLTITQPNLPVYLIAPQMGPRDSDFAEEVGAFAVSSSALLMLQMHCVADEPDLVLAD